jgi:hypothetical protein
MSPTLIDGCGVEASLTALCNAFLIDECLQPPHLASVFLNLLGQTVIGLCQSRHNTSVRAVDVARLDNSPMVASAI